MLLCVDCWSDDHTWWGWFANYVLYCPPDKLRRRDELRELKRQERRARASGDIDRQFECARAIERHVSG